MRNLLVLGTIIALSIATAGQAASVAVTVDAGTDVGGGLTAYVVSLDVTGGDGYANQVDIEFGGSYNQEWGDVVMMGSTFPNQDPTPDQEQAAAKLSSARQAQDSHFLFDDDESFPPPIVGSEPDEGDQGSGPPPDRDLNGFFGWLGSTNPKPIAQIVVSGATPYDTTLVEGWVWVPFNGATDSEMVWIPEPTTLGLLVVGVVGLIRRRR